MDNKQFLSAYQRIKFLENESDCFSTAAIKRITLLLNYYGSIHLNQSNDVTEFFLYQNFIEYAKVADNKSSGKVNNYADEVLDLLYNYQNDDKRNWKSHLNDFELKKHLDLLDCSNDINCNLTGGLSVDELKELKLSFEKNEENESFNNFTKSKLPINQTFTEKNSEIENCVFQSKIVRENTFLKKEVENVTPVKEENQQKSISFSSFHTAKDELQIQNAKKFAKGGNGNDGLNDKNLGYALGKKSLGTRKGGPFAKFQPPNRSKDTKNEMPTSTIKMEVDEIVDERLKNIDPAMIELIRNEIMDCGSKITWDDIAGLHLAKSTIQEIVVWPMLRPDIFMGLRRPPKGILLFGPPGTGKTLIGKCIASQSNSTFFSISASSLTSKWVGDGEKMVRTLFAVAKVHQPSVVFVDEIDSLLSQRSDSEHESSRRIKTEFLVQLDGAGTGDEDRILIIGATNRPQELDEAARRRLVKRLYIPLPDEDARRQIIKNLISSERHCLTNAEIDRIAELTNGYSGADVKNLCQEASLGPIRSIAPSMIQSISSSDVRPLNSKDFESALCRIKSSVSERDLDIYIAWDKLYGCGSASQT